MAIIKLNEENYNETVLAKDKKVIVDFWAEWCGPCKMLAPVLEEFTEKHPEFIVGKVNIDEEPALASRFGIMSIPTVKLYENGEFVLDSVGYKTVEQLEELML